MSARETGGPAFPHDQMARDRGCGGMTLRQYYAGQALGYYLSTMPSLATYDELADRCVRAADALIAELSK